MEPAVSADRGTAAPSPARKASASGSSSARRNRIAGVDLARAAAILGMFAVHIGPTGNGTVAERVYSLPHGRASILFALVAGAGVTLLAASQRRSAGQARATLTWRAVLLLPLGLVLQELDHGVSVILQDYAVLFLLAIAVIGLSDRWLLALAGIALVAGPLGFLWGQVVDPDTFARQPAAWGDGAATIAHRLVLSGAYPLITWAAPFLFGMWLGRRDLRVSRTRLALAVGGGITAVAAVAASFALSTVFGEPTDPVGWDQIISDNPHTQMPLWLLTATGSAAMVLGLCLMAADAAERVLWPLVATGQLALTVYVGHLLALHFAPDALRSDQVAGATGLLVGFTVASAVVAVAWRAKFNRGPLEVALQPPWSTLSRRTAERRSAPATTSPPAGNPGPREGPG